MFASRFLFSAAAILGLAGCASAGDARIAAYAPMAPFAEIAGKTLRGEWRDPDGTRVVDIARYELILGGRALQSTHRLEGGDYGGRTIFFYDEASLTYVFHYFTTAGFHTTGEARFEDGAMVSTEKVSGHKEIAEVVSRATFAADEMRVVVNYVDQDGAKSPDVVRVYRPTADRVELF